MSTNIQIYDSFLHLHIYIQPFKYLLIINYNIFCLWKCVLWIYYNMSLLSTVFVFWKRKWKWLSHVWLFDTPGLYSPWNSPGQNTGVGTLTYLQGIFPTQVLDPDLTHCRQIVYQLSYQGSPFEFYWMCNNSLHVNVILDLVRVLFREKPSEVLLCIIFYLIFRTIPYVSKSGISSF